MLPSLVFALIPQESAKNNYFIRFSFCKFERDQKQVFVELVKLFQSVWARIATSTRGKENGKISGSFKLLHVHEYAIIRFTRDSSWIDAREKRSAETRCATVYVRKLREKLQFAQILNYPRNWNRPYNFLGTVGTIYPNTDDDRNNRSQCWWWYKP